MPVGLAAAGALHGPAYKKPLPSARQLTAPRSLVSTRLLLPPSAHRLAALVTLAAAAAVQGPASRQSVLPLALQLRAPSRMPLAGIRVCLLRWAPQLHRPPRPPLLSAHQGLASQHGPRRRRPRAPHCAASGPRNRQWRLCHRRHEHADPTTAASTLALYARPAACHLRRLALWRRLLPPCAPAS